MLVRRCEGIYIYDWCITQSGAPTVECSFIMGLSLASNETGEDHRPGEVEDHRAGEVELEDHRPGEVELEEHRPGEEGTISVAHACTFR